MKKLIILTGMILILFSGCASVGDIKTSVTESTDGDSKITSMYLYMRIGGISDEIIELQIVEKKDKKWAQVKAMSYSIVRNHIANIKFFFDGKEIVLKGETDYFDIYPGGNFFRVSSDSDIDKDRDRDKGYIASVTISETVKDDFLKLFQTAEKIRCEYSDEVYYIKIPKEQRKSFLRKYYYSNGGSNG